MLKLHAGVSKKVGLPGYSSASASCMIEAELDSSLLQDHEGFQVVVQRAYESCEKAVEDQIARLTREGPADAHEVAEPQPQPELASRDVVFNRRQQPRPGARRRAGGRRRAECRMLCTSGAKCVSARVRTRPHRAARNDRTRCSQTTYSGFLGSYAVYQNG